MKDVDDIEQIQAHNSATVNADLLRERRQATFDPIQLTYLRDGGVEKTRRRRFVESLALNDPDFKGRSNPVFMTRDQQYSLAVKNGVQIEKKLWVLKITDEYERQCYRDVVTQCRDNQAFSLHFGMFIPTILSQGTEEQQKRWLSLAENYQIIGTYAQTELGHGTFIRGLETTATYDPTTEEFVINSPTLTAMKWWPGYLGKTSTHAIVMAQLYSQGQCYGLHTFIVQLRSLEDHEPMPGVTVGDIGPKFGINYEDNGFARFDNVRIPRDNMLMKFAKILPSGQYVKPQNTRLSYGTLLYMRVFFLLYVTLRFASAVTIATRYSIVRRQSEIQPGAKEVQIMDFQSQQYKILPQLATVYAFLFTQKKINQLHDQLQREMQTENFASLSDVHGTVAGIKAFVTCKAGEGIEKCRLACGGHGYSEVSALPSLYTLVAVTITGEGESTVMYLQTARYLVKCAAKVAMGTKLPPFTSYLEVKEQGKCPAKTPSDLLKFEVLINAYQNRACGLVNEAAQKLQSEITKGTPQHVAWNNSHLLLIKAAEAHCHFVVMKSFIDFTMTTPMEQPIRDVLTKLCQLYALYGIRENAGDFLQDGYMNGDQISMVTTQIARVMSSIRPNAIALVDAFDFPDESLGCSALGRYDGNVYEEMYKWAKQSSLNKEEVHDSYYKYLRPLLKKGLAKL
ncbi:peroxisomal acyl-coenzyme A oxidase 1-like [Glandiceps talaboti]